jgi:hypothetical protein
MLEDRWRPLCMRRSVNAIKQLLEECSDEDRDQWKSHAQTVLEAVRASHPTRRGVKGAVAAAFFASTALPASVQAGWTLVSSADRRRPSQFEIEKDGRIARVLISALQVEAGKPLRQASERREPVYVSRLPRRPLIDRTVRGANQAERDRPQKPVGERGWLETDFDVLAVNLQPVTRNWSDFRYTLSHSLTPSQSNPPMIGDLQPVPLHPSGAWAADLVTCLEWYLLKPGNASNPVTSAT